MASNGCLALHSYLAKAFCSIRHIQKNFTRWLKLPVSPTRSPLSHARAAACSVVMSIHVESNGRRMPQGRFVVDVRCDDPDTGHLA